MNSSKKNLDSTSLSVENKHLLSSVALNRAAWNRKSPSLSGGEIPPGSSDNSKTPGSDTSFDMKASKKNLDSMSQSVENKHLISSVALNRAAWHQKPPSLSE